MKSFIPWKSLTLLVLLAFVSGCNTRNQQTGTLTHAAASYLIFTGDSTNAMATVDNLTFALTEENAKNHFELSPGIHRVKVEKQGRVVVDREILLSDRQTVEVAIP